VNGSYVIDPDIVGGLQHIYYSKRSMNGGGRRESVAVKGNYGGQREDAGKKVEGVRNKAGFGFVILSYPKSKCLSPRRRLGPH